MGIYIEYAVKPENCWTCQYEPLTICPCHIGIAKASDFKDSVHPDCPIASLDLGINRISTDLGLIEDVMDETVNQQAGEHLYTMSVITHDILLWILREINRR